MATKDNNLSFRPDKPTGEDKSTTPPSDSPPSDLASLEEKIRELSQPRPIYTPKSVHHAHSLYYDWTGWLSGKTPFPDTTTNIIQETAPSWESDGLHLHQYKVQADKTQIVFKTTPQVSPILFASRVKGRLQHALKNAGTPVRFSRKVAFRCLGENIRDDVEKYLGKQVRKEGFVDVRFIKRMEEFTVTRNEVDLSQPVSSHSGQYWYNLHLVIVVGGRMRIADYGMLEKIRDSTLQIGEKKEYRIKSVSVMPDHVHIAMGGNIKQSPEEIALSMMNNLAYTLGYNRVWEDKYYVGTFSEYNMDQLRRLT